MSKTREQDSFWLDSVPSLSGSFIWRSKGAAMVPTTSPRCSHQGEEKEGNEVHTFPFKDPTQNLHTSLPF